MTKLKMLAAVLAFAALTASAADTLSMKVVSFTGQIQIKMPDGSIVGLVPGAAMPSIPAGAEVTVVSGEAVLTTSNGVAVSCKQGDSFGFSAADGKVQIEAKTPTTQVKVTVGKTEATVGAGAKIAVDVSNPGKADVTVISGQAQVTVNGTSQTLSSGQSVTASTSDTSTTSSGQTSTTQTSTTDSGTTTDTSTSGTTTTAPQTSPTQNISPSTP